MEKRYLRNQSSISAAQQTRLAAARVLLVGLGGLGGTVLEHLARLGIGHIIGADGDVFEPSNCNRQVLATEATLGRNKAQVAAERVASVNPLVTFTPIPRFLTADDFPALLAQADVVVDALGGLALRKPLLDAAAAAGKPLVSAGIAGFTGWVQVIRPGERGAADLFAPAADSSAPGSGKATGKATEKATVEERLGNLSPVAAVAASMQAGLVLRLLMGLPVSSDMCIFDLADMQFQSVSL